MPSCVVTVTGSTGVVYLHADPAVSFSDPTCAYVVETYDEYMNGWHGLSDLSISDALTISTSIAVLWAVCWSLVLVRRALAVGAVSSVSGDDD